LLFNILILKTEARAIGLNFSGTGDVNIFVSSYLRNVIAALSGFTGNFPGTGGLPLLNGDLIRYHSLGLNQDSTFATLGQAAA
jgi:hypothetical protein